jgi:hypothetical protein
MEFKGGQTSNAATNGGSSQAAAPRFAGNSGIGNMNIGGGGNKKIVLAAIVAVAIIVIGGLAWWGWKQMGGTAGAVKGNQYQALFLTNGQVYFGKLGSVDDKYVKLNDIYYLQVQQTVQPDEKKATDSSNPQVSLAKLGSELHGPEDVMYVNREQVLFWENIKDDSKVVQAIKQNANK